MPTGAIRMLSSHGQVASVPEPDPQPCLTDPDDGTMINISAASGKLSFTARTNSYFYTTIPCGTAKTDEYNAVIFTIKGPAGAQFSLDIQTTSDCGSTSYQEYHHTISGFYGTTRTIRIPFSNFGNIPSGASIKAFVWGTFSQGNSRGCNLGSQCVDADSV